MKQLWVALFVLCCATSLQAEVFKWIDAEGKIQYGDAPPKGVNATKVSGGVTVMPAFTPPPPSASSAPVKNSPSDKETVRGGISAKPEPTKADPTQSANADKPTLTPREEARRKLIEECLKTRATNCDAEVDAQLNGQSGNAFVPMPGWSQPPIRPTPKPPVAEQSRPEGNRANMYDSKARKAGQ